MIPCAEFLSQKKKKKLNQTQQFIAGARMGFATLWDDEENDGTEDLSEEDQVI